MYRLPWLPLFLDGEGDPSGNGPPAAPPAAPAAPTPPATPPPEDRRSAVERAIETYQGQVESGEIAFTEPTTTPGPLRDEAGKFAKPAVDLEDLATPPPAAEGVAGTPAEAAGEGTEAQGAPPAADDPLLTVELPARRGQEPVSIKVPDKETAEGLRQLKNGFMKGEEVRAARADLAAKSAEYDYFQQLAQVDPVGLVLDHLDPAKHIDVARHLLATPGVYEALAEMMNGWDGNSEARRADVAELKSTRLEQGQAIRTQMTARQQQAAIVRDITDSVDRLSSLVPQDLADSFRDDALGDMSHYIRTNQVRGAIPAELFPRILDRRLRLYGVDPAAVAGALNGSPDSPDTPRAPRPKGAAAEALATTAQGARANGQKLVEAAKVRRDVAAAAPGAGAGVSTPRMTPPPKQGVAARVAWAKENMAALFGRPAAP